MGSGRAEAELAKAGVRERIWTLLELRGAVPVPPGAHDRIPNFQGAGEAATRIEGLAEWARAAIIKANPDKAQFSLRRRALEQGKVVYMAVPRLAKHHPFVRLDPNRLSGRLDEASTSEGGVALGQLVDVEDMEPIDLVVCGTVAVNPRGVRVGKGGGFSDLEVGMVVEAGLVCGDTPIVTTVHDLQLVDEDLPATAHDFEVDWIATPRDLLRTDVTSRRLPGILWDDLTREKVAAIPALRRLAVKLDRTELLV
jgi:5-formyltetrahydrofolate cyclo-ligase